MSIINAIIWIILGFILCWCIRERHLMYCFIRKQKKIKHKNTEVMIYNIQRLPWSLKPICYLRKVIKQHSIVCLQECFSNLLYDEIQHAFHEYHILKGGLTRYSIVNSGLVLLSMYPILSHTFIPYDVQDYLSSDVLSDKGFLVAKIKIKQKKLYVINTHLQASFINEINVIPHQQLQQLMIYVQTLDAPFIIGGDFNVDINSLPAFVKKGVTVYSPPDPTIYIEYNDKGVELNTSCFSRKGYTPFCYDYYMTSGIKLSTPSIIPFEYSDHLPVKTKMMI